MERSSRYPGFLCIGAHKGGTTWLHRNLRSHPQVCLPHKEFNYFNTRGQGLFQLVRSPVWRHAVRHRFLGTLFSQPWARSRWYARYLFRRRTDSWYASLFQDCGTRLAGDISPSYSTLDEGAVEHVARIMPAARIILLLRDPVERAWSHARMDYKNGWMDFLRNLEGPIEDLPADVLSPHFDNYFSISRGSYSRMLRIWGAFFPPEQLFVGYKEEIDEAPHRFLDRVAEFLGLDPSGPEGWPFAEQRVNAMPQREMPEGIARHLSIRYLGELAALEQNPLLAAQPYVSEWRQRAERRLAWRSPLLD